MENDSIRSSGFNTLVDIWIDGKVRAICVSQDAIGAYLGFDQAAKMTDNDRCEFVRAHLPLLMNAAKTRLIATDPDADFVTIELSQLPRPDGTTGDRRKLERRKTERRKGDAPTGTFTERRRRARRQSERRAPTLGKSGD